MSKVYSCRDYNNTLVDVHSTATARDNDTSRRNTCVKFDKYLDDNSVAILAKIKSSKMTSMVLNAIGQDYGDIETVNPPVADLYHGSDDSV